MKKIQTLLLFILLGWHSSSYAQSSTFSFSGAPRTWTVPPGVTSIGVDAIGARGGAAGPTSSITTTPGCGGRVQATIAVTAGQVLSIRVGGQGPTGDGTVNIPGGYPGGGGAASYFGSFVGGGGGGQSDIVIGTDTVLVAGGGGGAGDNGDCSSDDQPGGNGGGTTGATVTTCNATLFGLGATVVTPAGGGSPTTGGNGGDLGGFGDSPSNPGTFGAGGDNVSNSGVGGGGGGGYFGGGGGCWTGGGGGSSYTDPGVVTSVTHTQGYNCGNGQVSICAPNPGSITGDTTVSTCSSITLYDSTGTAGGTWVWSSSATGIATIDPTSGVVTPVAAGTTTITYTLSVAGCGTAYDTMNITVVAAPLPINGPAVVCVGSNSTGFGSTITLTDSTVGGGWASSNPLAATIDIFGGIFPVAPGVTTISYTIPGGCFATLSLTVNTAVPHMVAPVAICQGDTVTLTDAITGGTWTSSHPTTASIDTFTGFVQTFTATTTAGTTDITYFASPGCYTDTILTVSTAPLAIYTTPPDSQMCQGFNLLLNEDVFGGTWGSSNSALAPVFSSPPYGYVFGTSTGSDTASVDTISYTTPGCPSVYYPVTVNPNPRPITGITVICNSVPTTLSDSTHGGLWASTNPAVHVDSAGVVSSDTTGITSVIFYTLPTGCKVFITVNVDSAAAPILGADSVCLGASTTLTDSMPGGIWTTTLLAVAPIIATTGVVTGVATGTVNISYTLATGCYSTKSFTVSPLTPALLSVTQTAIGSMCAGTRDTLVATGANAGVDPTFVWTLFGLTDTLLDSSSIFIDTNATHGDVVMVSMATHNICAVHDVVIDTIALNVYPIIFAPTITITLGASESDTAHYLGDIITLYSTVTSGGTSQTYQWYKNRLLIPGATASSYAATIYSNDTFYCVVTGNPPCDPTATYTVTSGTIPIFGNYLAVRSLANSANLLLFPNPNTGIFTLSGSINTTSDNDVDLEVNDMLGRVIYRGKTVPQNGFVQQQITLNDVPAGSYLLHVNTEGGSEVFHFVISK